MNVQIAVLDDEVRMAEILGMLLRGQGHQVETFHRPSEFLAAFEERRFDLLLTDLKMPEMDGIEVLRHVKRADDGVPVILITAHATLQTAIAATRAGAYDYLEKPIDNEHCKALVQRALELTRLERENRYLREALRSRFSVDNILASSPCMHEVLDLAQRASRGRASVLIQGESGTGKELFARAIHYWSTRVGQPFVGVNCKAFAEGVLESELFGHKRGAFTGATTARAGVFERASGGTLFLDEIGETDPSFQVKLLRVLQEREVVRVGASEPRAVDLRLVTATNKDLAAEVEAGRFREDLYFRIAVIPIELPPLRQRRDDILPLASMFLARFAKELHRTLNRWDADVERYLITHDWPGNVRELENTIERAVVLARDDVITLSDILVGPRAPRRDRGISPNNIERTGTLNEHLDRVAAEFIAHALDECRGVRVDAARRLGVERTTLYRLMKKFDLD